MKSRLWTKTAVVVGIALILAIMPLLGACAQKAPLIPGVTLKLGIIADITGPASRTSSAASAAAMDYFKYLNDDKGGIEGYKIDVLWTDCKFQVPLGVDAYNRFRDQGAALMFGVNSPYVLAAKPFLARDKMPIITLANNLDFIYGTDPATKWSYNVCGAAPEECTSFMAWAQDNWKEKRPIKLALLYPDNSYGRAMLDRLPEWAKAKGIEIVAQEIAPMTPTDVSGELTKVKRANPDYVIARFVTDAMKVILRDRLKVGLGATIVSNYVAKPGDIVGICTKEEAEGVMISSVFAEPTDKSWGVVLADKIAQKYQNTPLLQVINNQPGMYMWGMGAAMIMEEAFRQAVKGVGADKITSEAMKTQGLDRVKNLDTGGLLGFITYTPTDHRGAVKNRILVIRNGKVEVLRDWASNEPVVDWSKPAQ